MKSLWNKLLQDIHSTKQLYFVKITKKFLNGCVLVTEVHHEGSSSGAVSSLVVTPVFHNLGHLEAQVLTSQLLPGLVHVEKVLYVLVLPMRKLVYELRLCSAPSRPGSL
jgi:hypothetical protein